MVVSVRCDGFHSFVVPKKREFGEITRLVDRSSQQQFSIYDCSSEESGLHAKEQYPSETGTTGKIYFE